MIVLIHAYDRPVMVMLQYLDVRRDLVEYVAQVAGRLQLRNETVHLAMVYVDRFRSRVHVQGARLLLSGVAALVVAAKFLDNSFEGKCDGLIPFKCSHVLAALGNPAGITTRVLVAYERRVLDALHWQLLTVTPSSFVCAYHVKGIFTVDDTAGCLCTTSPTPEDQRQVWHYTKYFCELVTLHGLSCTFGISVSAAASVAAARTIVGIHPPWPESLAHRLGHAHTQVEGCASAIVDLYRTEHAPQALDAASGEGHFETAGSNTDKYAKHGSEPASDLDTSPDTATVGASLQAQINADPVHCSKVDAATCTLNIVTCSGSVNMQSQPEEDSPTNVDSCVWQAGVANSSHGFHHYSRCRKRGRDGGVDDGVH